MRVLLSVALALLAVGCASAPPVERGPAPKADVTLEEAVAAFRALAFVTAEKEGGAYKAFFVEYNRARTERENRLVKWPDGAVLNVYHQGVRIAAVRPKIETALDDLSDLTGIPHVFREARRGANFIVNVRIEEREDLQCGSQGVARSYRPRPNRFDGYIERPPFTMHGFGISEDSDSAYCCISHVIYRRQFDARPIAYAHLSIDNLPLDVARTCALAHYGRAMGLNVTDRQIDSFLVRDSDIAEPTKLDELVLWALYDPRLKSGMTVDEAMPIARQVLEEALGVE